MEIEEVAAKHPEKILRLRIYNDLKLKGYQKELLKSCLNGVTMNFILLKKLQNS